MGTKNYRNSAFTLVELMIVIVIIAILAAIFIMIFQSQQLKANDGRRKADINRIKIAVEEYEKDHNCYPQYVTCGVNQSQPIYPYLNNVPCDPTTNTSYLYDYQNSVCPGWYRFYSKMQFTADPAITPNIGPNYAFNYTSGSANVPNSPSGGSTTATPGGTSSGGGGNSNLQYYGCRSGACVPINWNPNRPGPECDPNFLDSNCYGQCGPPGVECVIVN